MDKTKQPGVKVDHILLKSAHFEHREDFLSLPPNPSLETQVEVGTQIGLSQDEKRGFITIAVRSKDEQNPVYRFSLELMAFVSEEEGRANMSVKDFLKVHGATLTYPFAREALANLTGRGRFGPTYLKPFNIRAAEAAEGKKEEPGTENPEGSTPPG